MTTDTRLTASAVDPDVTASMQIYARIAPLKQALGVQDLSDPELQLFAMVAHHTGLDPFTKQIYAIKRAGKVTHQTGIDGYRSVAERTREYAGSDEAAYESCNCGKPPEGHPGVARVTVHRILPTGHIVDQVGVARWHELKPEPDPMGLWTRMPFNQLAKCAEANALRKAFPRVLGGVYIEDEMQQAGTVEGRSSEVSPVAPTVRERIHARREAVEPTPSVLSEPMTTEQSAAVEARCLEPSPYEEGGACGLPIGHDRNHKLIGEDGDIQGSW